MTFNPATLTDELGIPSFGSDNDNPIADLAWKMHSECPFTASSYIVTARKAVYPHPYQLGDHLTWFTLTTRLNKLPDELIPLYAEWSRWLSKEFNLSDPELKALREAVDEALVHSTIRWVPVLRP